MSSKVLKDYLAGYHEQVLQFLANDRKTYEAKLAEFAQETSEPRLLAVLRATMDSLLVHAHQSSERTFMLAFYVGAHSAGTMAGEYCAPDAIVGEASRAIKELTAQWLEEGQCP